MTAFTVKQLFARISGRPDGTLTHSNVKQFAKDAGLESGWIVDEPKLAAGAMMDKFGGDGAVSWDRFRGQAMSMVPPGLLGKVDRNSLEAVLDAQWSKLDPKGTGASVDDISRFLEGELCARGQSFAGTKAVAGAKMLMHALDFDGDKRLQKSELKGFLQDVLQEAGV